MKKIYFGLIIPFIVYKILTFKVGPSVLSVEKMINDERNT